jgi:hypothetical protein
MHGDQSGIVVIDRETEMEKEEILAGFSITDDLVFLLKNLPYKAVGNGGETREPCGN